MASIQDQLQYHLLRLNRPKQQSTGKHTRIASRSLFFWGWSLLFRQHDSQVGVVLSEWMCFAGHLYSFLRVLSAHSLSLPLTLTLTLTLTHTHSHSHSHSRSLSHSDSHSLSLTHTHSHPPSLHHRHHLWTPMRLDL